MKVKIVKILDKLGIIKYSDPSWTKLLSNPPGLHLHRLVASLGFAAQTAT
jgi:hypothetical protein